MRFLLTAALTAALLACGSPFSNSGSAGNNNPPAATDTPPLETGPFKVLVFSRTAGFRHASIEAGIAAIQQLGAANDFAVDATEDPTDFTAENLAQYRVIIWLNTTLDVLDTEAQQAAMQGFVENGGGFVGVHSAADTEHDWPWYGELVGAYFKSHPVQQVANFIVEDSENPSTAHLANPYSTFDEFYSFSTNPRGAVRVLLSIDESSYMQDPNTSCLPESPTFPQGFSGVMGDHPMSWCHDKFAGRAWYTELGHEIAQYQLPGFLDHLLGGIMLTARRVPADCSPDTSVPVQDPSDFEPHELSMCPVF